MIDERSLYDRQLLPRAMAALFHKAVPQILLYGYEIAGKNVEELNLVSWLSSDSDDVYSVVSYGQLPWQAAFPIYKAVTSYCLRILTFSSCRSYIKVQEIFLRYKVCASV